MDVIVAFGVLAVVIFLVVALIEPTLALAVALIAAPFQPLERVTLNLPIDSGQMLLALALFAYLLRWLAQRRLYELPAWRVAAPFVVGAAFLGVGMLSFFPARDLTDWLFECAKLVQLLWIGLLVANERDPRRRALIVGALFASACGEALLGVYQHHLAGVGPKEFLLPGTDRYRAYGTFEQPNPFGGYMGLIWPVAAGVALHLFRKRCVAWGGAAAAGALFCAYGVYISGSRGALIGAALAVVLMTLALLQRPGRWLAVGACVLLITFAFGELQVPAAIETQLAEYGDIDVRDAYITPISFSTIERLAHWQAALRMAEAHPWLGVGLGNYGAAYDDFRLLVWVNALGHAHNYYLNLLAETGLLGLTVYLIWWGTVLVWLWRARYNGAVNFVAVGLLGALGHLLGHSAFDNLYVANMHLVLGAWMGLAVVQRAVGMPTREGVKVRARGKMLKLVAPSFLRVSILVVAVGGVLLFMRPLGRAHAQSVVPPTLAPPTLAPLRRVAVAAPMPSPVVLDAVPMTVLTRSLQGRPIVAYQFGAGPVVKLLVGGIHGGYEFNTVQLMSRTIEHFAVFTQEVPADVTLFVIPNLNPDGAASGRDRVRGRMNGAGVDLNRNWDHAWQPQAWHGVNFVNAGAMPFSEPETRALRDFVREKNIGAAVFYHCQLGAVFHGAGVTETQTVDLAKTMADATGYVMLPEGMPGQVTTGDAIDYLTKYENVDAVEIELYTSYDVEWMRNLAGIRAFLRWRRGPEEVAEG